MTTTISTAGTSATAPAARAVPTRTERRLPGLLAASRVRSAAELRIFFRNVQSLVFTLALPIILLVIFGSIFTGKIAGTDTDFKQYFVAGIVAAGVMSTAFTGLAINVALERELGLVRRLASSPMPKGAYFVGKVVLVAVTSLLETIILVGIGTAFFGLQLPSDGKHWAVFAWVFVLGTAAMALCGLAYTAIIPSASAAAAIVTPPFLVLQFISGVFFPFNQLPGWMQNAAGLFPLKWLTQGFRYVFLPEDFQVVEHGGSWNLPAVAIALAIWVCVAGFLTMATFKWRGPKVK
ncbi:MAG TPA: ABC transporter permease [Tetrasphaera sp.]|uniref:ABC transporter permease n=1 Tax=Nostocoides sp. TaxID=1917966 RepID=UPI002BF99272|nr:ABC transporter permease [Tetrasphaera sp.]HNQ05772.1 ABC transporter permease [Tetrasphaera sp.]